MKRRLPKGEETLPIVSIQGKFYTPNLVTMETLSTGLEIPKDLLIERVRLRAKQGRASTIYRLDHELKPKDQLKHMKAGDAIGMELIEAERKLLEEELNIIREGADG